ncbi:MAG: hypothetical protein IIY92_03765, partial [Lachnospiraceae bacterium]|nr:hypothetical protein [Lachnospiraceae bacterium]
GAYGLISVMSENPLFDFPAARETASRVVAGIFFVCYSTIAFMFACAGKAGSAAAFRTAGAETG